MSKWPTVPLGDVLRVSGEKIEPAAQPSDVFNYVGLEHIEGHTGNLLPRQSATGAELLSTKNVFRAGQILYGKLRPYLNKVHLADTEGICSTDILVLDADRQRLNAAFAALYLRTPIVLSATANLTAGANLPRIDAKALLGIPLPLPPLAEQERIVRLMDEAAALCRLRTQADERTSAVIPALFDEMFGTPETWDRWPSKSFEAVVRDTQLGLVRGADEMGSERKYAYLRMDALSLDGSLDLGDFRRVDATPEEVARYSLRRGDFLFNTRNSRELVGKTAVFDDFNEAVLFNNNLMRVRFSEEVEPQYVLWLFQTAALRHELELRKAGTTSVVAIYWKALRTIPVPVPPIRMQRTFATRVAEVRALETEQAASRKRLEALSQSLLNRAFRGDL